MDKFFEFKETGMLFVEKILFAAAYPVLFICRNGRGELYLCVCCQANREGKKWLLAEVTPDIVVQMLTDRITIREAFLKADKKRFSVLQDRNGVRLISEESEDWDKDKSTFLPDAGEYMEAEEGEFDEEIRFYSKKDREISYDASVVVLMSENLKIKSENEMTVIYNLKVSGNVHLQQIVESYKNVYNMTDVKEVKIEGSMYNDEGGRNLAA